MLMVLLSSAVVMAHSAMTGHDMGDAAAICLAVVGTAAAIASAATTRGRPQAFASFMTPAGCVVAGEPALPTGAIRARAGPATTQVFRL